VPIDLKPPSVLLTPRQQFYGGADFTGLAAMEGNAACKGATLRWKEGTTEGSRSLT